MKQKLCDTCEHKPVCKYAEAYSNVFEEAQKVRVAHTFQSFVFDVNVKCNFFKAKNPAFATAIGGKELF